MFGQTDVLEVLANEKDMKETVPLPPASWFTHHRCVGSASEDGILSSRVRYIPE
ncbi:hypothetical protein OBBRIDRAFT_798149 [Obba rivulosa]|uniref:Uncharacterized protein n=1 Tax=Obba rivulosa TaxID=1052685 RepID=A0A8E2AJP8_9APHY|nr:hypothetical protein OBBRIDRAFT_798149 [Obba rivulosa]